MCHLTGFGTPVSRDKFLESLIPGAASGEAYSSGLYLRMHRALQSSMDATLLTDHPIVQVEEDLQKVPTELYYSHRVREYEKALHRGFLQMPFNLCLKTEVLKRHDRFKTKTPHSTMGQDSDTGVDDQRGIDGDTLNAIKLVLRGSASDKRPLLAVSDALDREEPHHLFHVAARLGLKDIVERMLDADMDASTEDLNGATPLIVACRGVHADIVSLLMDRGVGPWNRQRNGISSFH